MPVLGPLVLRRVLARAAIRPHVIDAERAAPHVRHGEITDACFAMMRRDPATLEARLTRVRAPTLVVWGRQDRVAPWTHGTRLAREIAGARLEIVDSGHAPEAHAATIPHVLSFLAEATAPKPAQTEPSGRLITSSGVHRAGDGARPLRAGLPPASVRR
jgi:pimeloyl-ACP methyl ester carboxylesterase